MVAKSIPVDLFNPGQVLASLGFLEAADALCGDAEGGFDWSDEANVRFVLRTKGEENPFEVVLVFLTNAEIRRCAPIGYSDPTPKKNKKTTSEGDEAEEPLETDDLIRLESFPAKLADRMTLPLRLEYDGSSLDIGHWSDGSSRSDFKLYAGNRSAADIAQRMLRGTGKTKGIEALWKEHRERLVERPFDVLTSVEGRFNLDARGAWTAIDAGYSPDKQEHGVATSPVVELLAVVGLEHARPYELTSREVRYAAWGVLAPPLLARAALAGARIGIPLRTFRFRLALSGKNKVVKFAEEETAS